MLVGIDEIDYFTREDRLYSRDLIRDARINNRTLFLSRIDLRRNFVVHAELAAALILFSNLFLMRASPSGTFKVAEFIVDDDVPRHAVINSMRALLTGEYSRVTNLDIWVQRIKNSTDLPKPLIARAQNSLHFFESYHSSDQNKYSEGADFLLSPETLQVNEPNNDGYLSISKPSHSEILFDNGDETVSYRWSDFRKFGHVKLRSAGNYSCVIFEAVCEAENKFAHDWVTALSSVQQ